MLRCVRAFKCLQYLRTHIAQWLIHNIPTYRLNSIHFPQSMLDVISECHKGYQRRTPWLPTIPVFFFRQEQPAWRGEVLRVPRCAWVLPNLHVEALPAGDEWYKGHVQQQCLYDPIVLLVGWCIIIYDMYTNMYTIYQCSFKISSYTKMQGENIEILYFPSLSGLFLRHKWHEMAALQLDLCPLFTCHNDHGSV